MRNELQIIMLLWRMGLIDGFAVVQFIVNASAQYGGIVSASAAGNFSNISPRVLLEPLMGLVTSYRFVKAAQTAAEQRARIAVLAAFLSTSLLSIVRLDPSTNLGLAGAIVANIAYMRALLEASEGTPNPEIDSKLITEVIAKLPSLRSFFVRGGSNAIMPNRIETPVLFPSLSLAQLEFEENCNLIIQTMFKEHTARRYLQGTSQKFKMIKFSPSYMAPIASTQLNTISLIGWTCFGVVLIGFTIFVALYVFQLAERKRYKNYEILTDVTDSSNSEF